jgi:D-amino-acid oxidase
MPPCPDVLVVGAGVAGLTTAIVLAESGLRVVVRARELPQRTHSVAAAAIWDPDLAFHASVARWGRETLAVLRGLARTPDTGLRVISGVEATRNADLDTPHWVTELDGRSCPPADLPDGYAAGWRFDVPIADMPVYLRYLTRRLTDAGVPIVEAAVRTLKEIPGEIAVIVNCTGLGARDLVNDRGVTGVRGQLVVVENPGIDSYFGEHTDGDELPTYFLPHGRYAVLGGTAEAGRYDTAADPFAAEAIVQRCAAIEPRLRTARIVAHRVGIRPRRDAIRLEHDRIDDRDVIHNYGHGGSGISVGWGCAYEVARLVHAVL